MTPDPPPTITAIHLADQHRGAMIAVDEVVAEAGKGLVGDRYHGATHRHVSVVSADELASAAEALGHDIAPGATRRNVTVSGGAIPTAPGTRFRLGDVEVEVVRKAAPCRRMDEEIGDGARRALHDRAGAVCRLIGSGTIRVGDPVAY